MSHFIQHSHIVSDRSFGQKHFSLFKYPTEMLTLLMRYRFL